MATVVFTAEEQQLIANAINYGLFNQPGSWEQFQGRLRNDWRRSGAVERALNKATDGVVGGTAELAKSVVTSPFRADGTVISKGGGLGDRPLQTLTGPAAFVPMGRLGAALAGATGGINTEAWKNINWAVPTYEGIRITPTFLPGTYANTLQHIMTGTRNPQIENKKAYARQKFRNFNTVSDTQLGKALGQKPQRETLGRHFGQQPQQQTQALPGGIVPFVHELWQNADGSVVMPNTRDAKRTFDNTRKYAYGDPNDETSVGAMTVKRVVNPETGAYDGRHWQVWFNGGAFGDVNADNPIFIDKSHDIKNYEEARKAVLSGEHADTNIKALWKKYLKTKQHIEKNDSGQDDFIFNPMKPPYQQNIDT